MNLRTIITSEIQYSRKNFLLGVITIAIISGTILAMVILSQGYDYYAENQEKEKVRATEQHMNRVLQNYQKITQHMTFTVRILPTKEETGGFYTEGYVQQTMPLEYVDTLCTVFRKEMNAVIPVLRQKKFWQEQHRSILMASTGPTVIHHPDTSRYYGYHYVQPGHIVLGYELHNGNGYKAGDTITILYNSFVIERCLGQRGSIDDITAWFNYEDINHGVNVRKLISEIWIWPEIYSMKKHDELVQRIRRILPETSVSAVLSPAVMKAKAVATAAQVSKKGIQKEKKFSQLQRQNRRHFLRFITGILMIGTILFVSCILFANCMRRKKELALLTALGYHQQHLAQLFVGRALLIAGVGGGIGSIIGISLGILGTALFWQVFYIDIRVITGIVGLILLCGIFAGFTSIVIISRYDPAQVLSGE